MNDQKDFLEQKRVEVDRVCRLNYGVLDTFLVPRQSERGECAAGGGGQSVCETETQTYWTQS